MAKTSQQVLDELQEQNEQGNSNSQQEQKQEQEQNNPNPTNEEKVESPSLFGVFDNYKPKKDEEGLYHVAIAKVHFSEQTGEYDGQKPYVQKFIKRDYDNFMKHAKALGYTTKLLYSPINA